MTRIGYAEVIGGATGGAANAGWFGDGSDGALRVEDGEALELEVAGDGYVFKQYESGYIGTGGTLTTANRCNGAILLFNGDLDIGGHVHMDKRGPLLNDNEAQVLALSWVAACAAKGAMGGNGGTGGSSTTAGGIGGNGHSLGGGWPGGGGAKHSGNGYYSGDNTKYTTTSGPAGAGEPRPPFGTTMPYPGTGRTGSFGAGAGATLNSYGTDKVGKGGSAPGGGGALTTISGVGAHGPAGSGYPGGFLAIFVKGKVNILSTGIVSADGGNGAAGGKYNNYQAGGGGGGGGGIVVIAYGGSINNAGSTHAYGGTGGIVGGADGGEGTVLITKLSDLL